MKLPKQLEGKSIDDLSNPSAHITAYDLKWWGVTLFSRKDLVEFDRLFDAELITPIESSSEVPYRLRCVINYKPFFDVAIVFIASDKTTNDGLLLTNLAKAFAIASLLVGPSNAN
jgi:hypothetical protein